MSKDQFAKLFTYMQTEFTSTRNDIQKVRTDVQRVYEVVDGNLNLREADKQE